jgi:hypothetical protein
MQENDISGNKSFENVFFLPKNRNKETFYQLLSVRCALNAFISEFLPQKEFFALRMSVRFVTASL